MVEVVSGRTALRKAGARYSGRCPFHEERTPSFSVNPADKLYHCFGCGKGGDVITFVRETENLDFAGAVEWLAERFRVTLEYEETSPQQEESRKRRDRLHARARPGGLVLRALPLGGGGRRPRARVPREPRPRRGRLPRVPPRSLARHGPRPEGAREGLHRRRAARRRADERARQRLLPAAADVPARGRPRPDRRLPGAQAARRRSAPRQVRELARRASSSTSRRSSTGSISPARRSRSRSGRSSSRGTPT